MKYEFWDTESERIITWSELQDEKYVIRAGSESFYLIDSSREDDDGYELEILGEWRKIGDN